MPFTRVEIPGERARTTRVRVEVYPRRARAGAPSLPGPRRRVVVGLDDTNPMDAAQVRAVLDRVNARWLSLKTAAANASAEGRSPSWTATRRELLNQWAAWRAFYVDAYDDWLAWGTNVLTANEWDREADAWRASLEAEGIRVANPTTSSTGDAPEGSWWPWLLGGSLVVAGLYFYSVRNAE